MDNKQILEKAIQKAIGGGWKPIWKGEYMGILTDIISGELYTMWSYKNAPKPFKISLAFIFLDKNFAKALWGEAEAAITIGVHGNHNWRYHLQEMVIAENPIKYLKENT